MDKRYKYDPKQDYCEHAKNFQSVPSFEQYHNDNPDYPLEKIDEKRSQTNYSCADNYHMGSIQDNQIYIATTDDQHDIIASNQKFCEQEKVGGPSGYFSDQATVDACKTGDALDNTKYNEMAQIAPHRKNGINGTGDASYKPHVDCFEIDRDALHANYGTSDFNAAISKCEANNHFGSGGGNQGYNPYISEMIDNGTLKHNPERSFSDSSISKSEHNNPNALTNSSVSGADYKDMMNNARARSQDCVNNNTPHPSSEACNNGFPKNETPISSETGNATPVRTKSEESGTPSKINSDGKQDNAKGDNPSVNNSQGRSTKDVSASQNPANNNAREKPKQETEASASQSPSAKNNSPELSGEKPEQNRLNDNSAASQQSGTKPTTDEQTQKQSDTSTQSGAKPNAEEPTQKQSDASGQNGTKPGKQDYSQTEHEDRKVSPKEHSKAGGVDDPKQGSGAGDTSAAGTDSKSNQPTDGQSNNQYNGIQ